MAEKKYFVCSHCRYAIEAHYDGNVNNMLCLACGSRFKRALDKQAAVCPRWRCKSNNVIDFSQLEGKTCPSCKTGTFQKELMDGS